MVKGQDCATLQTDAGTGFLAGTYTINTTCVATSGGDIISSANIIVDEGGDLTINVTNNLIQTGGGFTLIGDGAGGDDGLFTINGELALEEASVSVQTGSVLTVSGSVTTGNTSPATTLSIDGNLVVGGSLLMSTNTILAGAGVLDVTGDIIEQDDPGTINDSGWTGTENCGGTMCAVLPVELVAFGGKYHDNQVILDWSTASEINNEGFYVERSRDGRDFNSLAFVKGKGNSSDMNHYRFSDLLPLNSDAVYYRLRQVDFDGTTAYSPTILVDLPTVSDLRLFPTYVTNSVSILGDGTSQYEFSLVSLSGTKLLETLEPLSLQETNTLLNDVIHDLKAGLYILNVEMNGNKQVFKFVKR
ncbi:MAG: hypothetical protein Tsb0034_13240 [Ekhidna sp.]